MKINIKTSKDDGPMMKIIKVCRIGRTYKIGKKNTDLEAHNIENPMEKTYPKINFYFFVKFYLMDFEFVENVLYKQLDF